MAASDTVSRPRDVLYPNERDRNVTDPDAERWVLGLHPDTRVLLARVCNSSRRGLSIADASVLVRDQIRQYVKIVEPARQMARPTSMGRRLIRAWREYQARYRSELDS